MVFSVPGGGVAALLRDSPTFGPRINAGLQAQGLLPGTSLYAQYFRDVQNIVDAGDPLNFVTVGRGSSGLSTSSRWWVAAAPPPALPDQVIPNSRHPAADRGDRQRRAADCRSRAWCQARR